MLNVRGTITPIGTRVRLVVTVVNPNVTISSAEYGTGLLQHTVNMGTFGSVAAAAEYAVSQGVPLETLEIGAA